MLPVVSPALDEGRNGRSGEARASSTRFPQSFIKVGRPLEQEALASLIPTLSSHRALSSGLHHLSPLPLLPPVPAPSISALGCCSSLLTGPLLPLLLNTGFQHSGHGDPLNTCQIISLPYCLPTVLHDIFRPPARFCLPYSIPVTWHFTDLATHRSI